VDTTDHAWAAGFFDAEGSVLVRRQRTRPRRELAVSQAGGQGTPQVLERFREIVNGRGTIRGSVERVMRLLWPWLDDAKRAQAVKAIVSARSTRHRASTPLDPIFEQR